MYLVFLLADYLITKVGGGSLKKTNCLIAIYYLCLVVSKIHLFSFQNMLQRIKIVKLFLKFSFKKYMHLFTNLYSLVCFIKCWKLHVRRSNYHYTDVERRGVFFTSNIVILFYRKTAKNKAENEYQEVNRINLIRLLQSLQKRLIYLIRLSQSLQKEINAQVAAKKKSAAKVTDTGCESFFCRARYLCVI